MGRPISIFSGYSQKENRVTNYCLLVLKMLYEENPKYLGEVLAGLIGEDVSVPVGVTFHQQERLTSGIPDGIITQKSLRVHIETKNWDWFHDAQLERHLADLAEQSDGIRVLLALGNFSSDDPERFATIRSICLKKYRGRIVFNAVSFDDFLTKISLPGLSKNLADTFADFKTFLSEENLLPSWRERLDVVNCVGIPEEIIDGGVYMCPAEGGAYSHERCRYFGMYRNKCVELIAEIDAVVDVDLSTGSQQILWKNAAGRDADFKSTAVAKVEKFRPGASPTRVFVLGELFRTNFVKDSPGGMQQSKRYFNIAKLGAAHSRELAERLLEMHWSDLID